VYWCMGNYLVLGCAGPPIEENYRPVLEALFALVFTVLGAHGALLGVSLKAIWALSRVGQGSLSALKATDRESDSFITRLIFGAGFTAIGLAHPKSRAEVRKHVEKPLALNEAGLDRKSFEALSELDQWRRGLMLELLDGPSDKPYESFQSERTRATELLGSPTEVLALCCNNLSNAMQASAPPLLFTSLPHLVKAQAPELYLPASENAKLARFEPEDALELLRSGAYAVRTSHQNRQPVRVEGKPGRNEPCACGSGKKAKRCCAA
jgi:uncharacterized protein YecA (UPF0149 family)